MAKATKGGGTRRNGNGSYGAAVTIEVPITVDEIDSREKLEAYLYTRPVTEGRTMACRAALRVFPLVGLVSIIPNIVLDNNRKQTFTLQSFRAALVLWLIGRHSGYNEAHGAYAAALVASDTCAATRSAAFAAARETEALEEAASGPTSSSVTNAYAYAREVSACVSAGEAVTYSINAALAADTAAAAYSEAAKAASAAAEASADEGVALWNSVRRDLKLLAVEQQLSDVPRWPNSRMPEFLIQAERRFAGGLEKWSNGWPIIAEWYECVRDGRPAWGLSDPQLERFVIPIVQSGDEFWGTGKEDSSPTPDEVMAEFARRLAEVRGETTSTDQEADANPSQPASESGQQPSSTEAHLQDDLINPDIDFLDRAPLAFILAGRLNQIWDRMNPAPAARSIFDSARWTGREPPALEGAMEPGFVAHLDAPWGGGKTAFAEHLAYILNPYRHAEMPDWFEEKHKRPEERLKTIYEENWKEAGHCRPWHIVHFNAWQHQHVTPPWWDFSESIRQQCDKALSSEDNWQENALPKPLPEYDYDAGPPRLMKRFSRWARRKCWEIFTPDTLPSLIFVGLMAAAAAIYVFYDHWNMPVAPHQIGAPAGSEDGGGWFEHSWLPLLITLLGGGATVLAIVQTSLKTLFSGTPAAASAYSLGSGDPLTRFRRHFAKTIKAFRRPVLVIVDDLDRCEPAYIVELVRGMQTVLQSPRVVYLLLGDRDWIENAFAQVYDRMKGIEVGPEHSFGGRFVEKAIRFSFVLPKIDDGPKEEFVRKILNLTDMPPQPGGGATAAQPAVLPSDLETLKSQSFVAPDFTTRNARAAEFQRSLEASDLGEAEKKRQRDEVNLQVSLRSAGDKSAEAATSHYLEGMVELFPGNPRQIKRIVNAVTLIQEVGRLRANIQPGSPEWQQLARWIVLSIEWPKSWFTLSRMPELADRIIASIREERELDWPFDEEDERPRRFVPKLLTFSNPAKGWNANNHVNGDAIRKFASLMPPVSGEMLKVIEAEPKPEKPHYQPSKEA